MKVVREHRRVALQFIDMFLWAIGAGFAMLVTVDTALWQLQVLAVVIAVHIIVYQIAGMYQVIWRYAGIRQLMSCIGCEAATFLLILLGGEMFFHMRIERFALVGFACTAVAVVSSRLGYLALVSFWHGGVRPVRQQGVRTLIIGAGSAARILLDDMQRDEKRIYAPVGLLDDDTAKQGRKLQNVKVYGPVDELVRFAEELDAELIVFAIFDISAERKQEIIKLCAATGRKVKMSPSPKELREIGEGMSRQLRNVDINDLLGREPVLLDNSQAAAFIKGRRVLVTGAGGSIGSELCRQIASMEPSELVLLDVYENSTYDIQQELIRRYGDKLNMSVKILSICDQTMMERVFQEHRPELLFHAAAHKHVPLMESAPIEAIKNNVFGTLNTAQLADKYGVKRFVMISTDKAVNPTNVMGATKRCCELIIQLLNRKSATEYVAVRFGNVLGSNGSVIPLFTKQIADGGPVTVTHPDMIRYFMTIPEAVRLVLTAGSMANGGEIFVLDMGKPVHILDLANNMIRLMGLVPDKDIKIEFTGLRPGEKLFEELLLDEEGTKKTGHEKIFVAAPLDIDERSFQRDLDRMHAAVQWGNREDALRQLHALVPTYHKEEEHKPWPAKEPDHVAAQA